MPPSSGPYRPGFALRVLIRCTQRRTLRAIAPDSAVVVSTYPGASQVLGSLRRRGRLDVPAITYLTDFSVHPLWVAPGIDAHLAAHAIPAAQARVRGAAGVMVTGPMAGPRFAPAAAAERSAARLRFGLPDGVVLALLVAGSWGVGAVRSPRPRYRPPVPPFRWWCAGATKSWRSSCGPTASRLCAAGSRTCRLSCVPATFSSRTPVGSPPWRRSPAACRSAVTAAYPATGRPTPPRLDEAGLAVWIRNAHELGPALTELARRPARTATALQRGLRCSRRGRARPR